MIQILGFIYKYWSKHQKKVADLLFSGVLMTAVVVVAFYQFRASYNNILHSNYDLVGMFEVMFPKFDDSDLLLNELTVNSGNYRIGHINITGKDGIGARSYTCGFLNDEYGLAHIPLEKGRLPENDDEVAIDSYILNQFCWVGDIGDTIKLNSGTYCVTGIIDEIYGKQRSGTEISIESLGGNIPKKPLPVIYFAESSHKKTLYSFTMLDGISRDFEDMSALGDILYQSLGEDVQLCALNDKSTIAASISEKDEFRYDVKWVLLLSGIAAVIAILSVFSILRIIIRDRNNDVIILSRLGASKRLIIIMHIVECIMFTIIQTIIGSVIGVLIYYVIYKYQNEIIGLKEYNGFTNDLNVLKYTYNPFCIAVIFSIIIMIAAYIIIVMSIFKMEKIKGFKFNINNLFVYYTHIFRQHTTTLIQIISLTFIGLSVTIGYMYYTDNGKTSLNYLTYVKQENYELGNGLDLKKNKISEYYYAPQPTVVGIEAYNTGNDVLPMADGNYTFGIDDNTSADLGDVVASGTLKQTFIISEKETNLYNSQIKFLHDDEKEFILQNSNNEYKSFFEEGELGTKYLYRVQTKLTNKDVILNIEKYVTSGSINYDSIESGKEILIITSGINVPFEYGDIITIGSISSNNNYGIDNITNAEVKVGAVITLPDNMESLLKYAVESDDEYNFLTTVHGARSINLHNAVYTEIFACSDVDGGLIPSDAGMSLISYEDINKELLKDKFIRFGGMILVIMLMSLLGFAAYFNNITIKINTNNYQISVLRALGDSKSHICRYLLISNLSIPIISGIITSFFVIRIKTAAKSGYYKLVKICEDVASGNVKYDDTYIKKMTDIKEKYFLENELWQVPTERVILIVYIIMMLITVLLTVAALNRFRSSISDDINKERKRA